MRRARAIARRQARDLFEEVWGRKVACATCRRRPRHHGSDCAPCARAKDRAYKCRKREHRRIFDLGKLRAAREAT